MDCSLPGTSVHGISQARILDWVAMSFCRRSSWPGDWIHISCIAGGLRTTEPPGVGRWQPERPAHALPALGMPGDLLHWTLLVTLSYRLRCHFLVLISPELYFSLSKALTALPSYLWKHQAEGTVCESLSVSTPGFSRWGQRLSWSVCSQFPLYVVNLKQPVYQHGKSALVPALLPDYAVES